MNLHILQNYTEDRKLKGIRENFNKKRYETRRVRTVGLQIRNLTLYPAEL